MTAVGGVPATASAATPRSPLARPGQLAALVALRDPGEGKTRLSPALSRTQRAEVTRAMARDVADALVDAGVTEVLIVAKGPRAARFGRGLELPVLRDRSPGAGLNAALGDAFDAVGPGRPMLLVCADLPGLRAADVIAVTTADADVVVAPTRGGGTGGLLLRAGARIEPAYGRASAAAHRRRCARAGLSLAEVVTPGFHHDVDEPAHLHEAVARWPGSRTGRVVMSWSR